MKRLLRERDYISLIQYDDLQQIIEEDSTVLTLVEQAAQAEMSSYLAARYRVEKIFSGTTEFDLSSTYYGSQLVEYTADAFSTATTYSASARTVYNGYVYKNLTGSTGTYPTNTQTWTRLVLDKTLYSANLPANPYSLTTTYEAGDVVFFDDYTYTALTQTTGTLPTVSSIWSEGTLYDFTGHYPEDSNYWTQGDNRNPLLVMHLVDLVLYHLHSRINPRNIPTVRIVRYDGGEQGKYKSGAIGWLCKVASGELSADLPEILPSQGVSIRFGTSDIKNTNTY